MCRLSKRTHSDPFSVGEPLRLLTSSYSTRPFAFGLQEKTFDLVVTIFGSSQDRSRTSSLASARSWDAAPIEITFHARRLNQQRGNR